VETEKMRNRKVYLVVFFSWLLIWAFSSAYAQRTKSQLQKEKQQNLLKIQETEKIISETAKQKHNSLGELTALNQRIHQQENLIQSVKNEINFLDADIDENNQIIEALQEDVAKLKEEYSAMLFSAQKASGKVDKLMFLFSSKNFDQLLMRLKYMEQYSHARKVQAEAILKVQQVLGDQVKQTEVIKGNKSKLLNEEIRENENLTGLKQKKKEIVKSLEKEEKLLKKDLDETKKAIAVLDKLINDIIREEIERAAREAREREAKAKANKKIVETAPSLVLSSSFEENRSKFPWPVSGFVSQKFGRQEHPVLKGIILQNDGINIQTKQEEKVKCIFEGEVRAVAFIPSIGTSVILSHGEYFTVYSGLKDVLVKKGQKVNLNQEIGQVLINSDGVSELRFQIRKNTVALDPQAWLKN
jgi:septal ring factor EnvC (AmiA/AmiB activator)